MDRNLLEQIVVELEVVQVHELAPVTARDIASFFQLFGVAAGDGPVAAVDEYRFWFRYISH
jgi:hypothetical protein